MGGLSFYCLQVRNLRLKRRGQLWDQGLHVLSGCRMDQSTCFRDAWALFQKLPITPILVSGNGMGCLGRRGWPALLVYRKPLFPPRGLSWRRCMYWEAVASPASMTQAWQWGQLPKPGMRPPPQGWRGSGNGGHACGCFPGKGRREEEREGEQPAAGHCCS